MPLPRAAKHLGNYAELLDTREEMFDGDPKPTHHLIVGATQSRKTMTTPASHRLLNTNVGVLSLDSLIAAVQTGFDIDIRRNLVQHARGTQESHVMQTTGQAAKNVQYLGLGRQNLRLYRMLFLLPRVTQLTRLLLLGLRYLLLGGINQDFLKLRIGTKQLVKCADTSLLPTPVDPDSLLLLCALPAGEPGAGVWATRPACKRGSRRWFNSRQMLLWSRPTR